jgi:outer membrane receptor protein involved in Fe transport
MSLKAVLTCLFLLFFIHSFSQSPPQEALTTSLTGQVLDSSNRQPIEYATVSLFLEGETKTINGALSNAQGRFKMEVTRTGIFDLLVESIGYLPFTVKGIHIEKNAHKALEKIYLGKKITRLADVTVIASQNPIETKIDKMVFNAEKDLTSQGGVATDLLKKIPMVSVDVDGNVELAGSNSIRFLIDGKPSTAFGNNIADVLQSIPASQIKSIEVITNPGAKYDAEGLGGIINIILKHSMMKGVNGNISLTAASRNENGSLNLNARNGNFGVNLYASGNYRIPVSTPYTSTRISQDTGAKTQVILEQDGSSRLSRFGVQAGLGVDYTLHKKNIFNFSISSNSFGNNSNGYLNQSQSTSDNNGFPVSDVYTLSETQSDFRLHEINSSLDYKRTFNKEDQELNIGIHSSFGKSTYNSNNNQFAQPGDSLFYGTNNNNPGKQSATEIVVDYTQPMAKDFIWGFGGKMSFMNINSTSNVLSLQPPTGNYLYDSSLSNSLHYQQTVSALYTELSLPVYNWFDAKLGLRYERTELNTFFSNISQQVPEPGYNTFVPSLFLSRKLNDHQTIRLSYSKRINRPDYRELNPFVNTTDPNNFTSGNPYLKPEIQHRFELAWKYDLATVGSFMVTSFYRTSQDDIQPYVVYHATLPVGDTIYNNVSVSTQQNIGLEKDLGMNLFADIHPTTKFNVRGNFFVFYRRTENAIDPGQNSQSWNYRANLNMSYNFTNDFAGEFFGNFTSPRNELQGKYPSFSSYTLAFRKQIWKKKGSVALTATNIFSEYINQTTKLYGQGFTTSSTRQVPFRSIGINFTWKFGKLEFKKPKPENTDNVPSVD